MMADIIHWNCRGLNISNRTEKTNTILQYLEKPGITSILHVVETRLKCYDDIPDDIKGMDHLYHIIINPCPQSDSASGTLLIINKTDELMEKSIVIPGRLMFCKTRNAVTKKETVFISLYMKSKWSVSEYRDCFKKILDISDKVGGDNVVPLGDFNFVTSKIDRNKFELSNNEQTIASSWLEVERKCDLIDSFRVTNPRRKLYSFSTADQKVRSRIDRIYFPKSWSNKIKSSVFIGSPFSDHKIVILKLSHDIDKGPGSWILNNSFLSHPDYQNGIK